MHTHKAGVNDTNVYLGVKIKIFFYSYHMYINYFLFIVFPPVKLKMVGVESCGGDRVSA